MLIKKNRAELSPNLSFWHNINHQNEFYQIISCLVKMINTMLQLRTYPSLAKGRITVYLTLGRDEFSVYPDIPIVSKDKGVVMNGKDLTM